MSLFYEVLIVVLSLFFSLLLLQPFNFSLVCFACNFQDWGWVILREIDFLLKICWSIPRRTQVHFWTRKSWKCAQNFLHKPPKAKTSKMLLNSKQLRFWTHKSWNCAMNLFCKPCKQRTSKIRLNFTEMRPELFPLTSSGENFQNACEFKSKQLHFWTQKSRKYAHILFMKLARGKRLKSVWTSWHTDSCLEAKIVKIRPEIFL